MPPRSNILCGLAALSVVLLIAWAQNDDEAKRIADQQDAEALNSRKWVAAQYACPKGYTADWIADKEMRCLRNLDEPVRVAGSQP